jgi:predicted nucleic acid-binding protein
VARKYVLDTNCFIEASRNETAAATLAEFNVRATPFLYLSSAVAAELTAGTANLEYRHTIEEPVLGPYQRRGRVLTPSRTNWDILGKTLSELVWKEGLELQRMPRSFMLDILIAHSCREYGMVLISSNTRDLQRINRIFAFEWIQPFPNLT